MLIKNYKEQNLTQIHSNQESGVPVGAVPNHNIAAFDRGNPLNASTGAIDELFYWTGEVALVIGTTLNLNWRLEHHELDQINERMKRTKAIG